ncbi:MAG: hypothetical protein AAF657_39115 [Acidobacteriota bacterium]
MPSQAADERILRALLILATIGLTAALICAWGWHRAATRRAEISLLSAEDRQRLVDEVLAASPGTFAAAWYEPQIAYTLKRAQEVSAWNDTFTTNALGYRTGPAEKKPGTFRVLFVGDSWTFGLGVKEEESFPKRFEGLANDHAGLDQAIEAWTLALPGYNTHAEVAALWYHFDRLQPDFVILCPTANDNHSMASVLPNGSLSRFGVQRDAFGEPHNITYLTTYFNSYRYLARWRHSFSKVRASELRLRRAGVPLLLFFVGHWQAAAVPHRFIAEAGIEAPYLILPIRFSLGEWQNPPPFSHASPTGNALYGRMVYQGLAELAGWPVLPLAGDDSDLPLHRGPPPGVDWRDRFDDLLDESTAEHVPEDFRPASGARFQHAGPLDLRDGRMSGATTILIRKRAGSRSLQIAVRRITELPSLYPQELTVSIPSPSDGTEVVTTVPATGSEIHRFTLAIPQDIAPGQALDVIFQAEHSAAVPGALAPRSMFIEAIEQSAANGPTN